ncbi:SDA1-domain-containing protein [Geopyxis carbonaria]|nr:SDA1-domain-containing protein [Geopyxis carbonaria]
MVKRKRAGLVKLNNLPMLQNLIRRDPPSYREEFERQHGHYESQRAIFMSQPTSAHAELFAELIGFMAQVSSCYPDLTPTFSDDLAQLLIKNHAALDTDLREKLVQSLVLLRNKDVISSITLLQTLFPVLTATQSKQLRGQIYRTVITDIRNANNKTRNHKLNKTVQAVLFELVEAGREDKTATAGLWAVKVTRELWKRSVWDDSRTVEIMKGASLSANPKVMSGGVRFFLGVDQEKEDAEEESDIEGPDMGRVKHQVAINKKKRSNKKIERAAAQLKRKEKNKNKPHALNFSALHLLHDPQGFAEALYSKHLSRTNNKLNMEQKLLVLQLVSRLVGLHKLNVLGLYSYMLKYLTPRQRDVTHFLICAAQATHDLVPPDSLEPLVRKIADEFVSEGVAGEVATAGLNAIREICARAPLAMNATLLQDLTEYKGSKDKGVMMAARSLIGLYREVAPEMLKRKDRGKVASMESKGRETLRYGEEKGGIIEGLELLEKYKQEQKALKHAKRGADDGETSGQEDEDDGEDGWDGWELEEDDSEDETGWIEVESDAEIEISDSEDDENAPKKKSKKTDEGSGKNESLAKEHLDSAEKEISTLATTNILTPADFAKLEELRQAAGLERLMGKSHNKHEDAVDEAMLAGGIKRGKSDREARIAAVAEGREDREKYKSNRGKKLAEKAHSTTNREKARKKNFLMTLGKAKKGQKRKLTETRRLLKAASDQRKGKKRQHGDRA